MKPHDILEGYILKEQLGFTGWYIETWRATDAQGGDVVLKIHDTLVSDDYSNHNDLTAAVAELGPQLDRLVSLPAVPGLAGWLRYHFNPQRNYLVACRRYYPARLADRFPIQAIGPPVLGLLQAIGEIACGLDFLAQHAAAAPAPVPLSNLLMDQSHAFLADFGLHLLHRLIEEGYAGPRRCMVSLDSALSSLSGQSALAAVYFYLRTGRIPFHYLRWDSSQASLVNCYLAVEEYHRTGILTLDSLPADPERQAVARALARDPQARFPSCREFVNALKAAAGSTEQKERVWTG